MTLFFRCCYVFFCVLSLCAKSANLKMSDAFNDAIRTLTFTCIHLAETFIQSDLQLLNMSEVARLWSN